MIDEADWRALGTGVRLVVLDGDLAAARGAVERVLAEADLAYSRFRSDSELSHVNAQPGRTVALSPLLARAIEGALDAARRTGGAVDPTVGRAMRLIGYDRDFDLLAGSDRPLELLLEPVPGWSDGLVRPHAAARSASPRGVELDLGSTGKGLAADLAAEAALARRRPGSRRPRQPRRRHRDRRPGPRRRLAGPGRGGQRDATRRRGRADRHRPRAPSPPRARPSAAGGRPTASASTTSSTRAPGLPAETPWRTVSVVAATAELANGRVTAAIVMGDAAPGLARAAGLPARLVANDGERHPPRRLAGARRHGRRSGAVTGPKGAGRDDSVRDCSRGRGVRSSLDPAPVTPEEPRCSTRSCGSRPAAPAPCRC